MRSYDGFHGDLEADAVLDVAGGLSDVHIGQWLTAQLRQSATLHVEHSLQLLRLCLRAVNDIGSQDLAISLILSIIISPST